MALRWIEGFEGCSINQTVHGRLYESVSGVLNAEDSPNELSAGEAVSGYDWVATTKPLVAVAENSWIVGFAFAALHFNIINNGDIPYVSLKNDDGEQIRFEFVQADDPNGKPGGFYYKIRVMRGATELASSNERFQIGTSLSNWYYFEFKATIDNAAGSFAGRFQHVIKPSLGAAPTTITWDAASTSIDTQNQTTTGANRFEVALTTGNALNRVYLDDLYVCDSTGAKNNDYLGKVIIVDQNVSGDGATVDWTLTGGALSTEDAWNEPTTSIEDDKRLTSDVISQVHLATVAAIGAILPAGAAIIGLRQDIHARMETTGDLDIAHMFRKTTGTPAQTNAGTPLNVDSTTYEGSSLVLENDPNTATDWARADLDTYQHGVRNDG